MKKVQIPKSYKTVNKISSCSISKEELIKFETEIKNIYDNGKIKAPIHLSRGNEDQLIEIFSYIKPTDYVFSNWRSHYHALLHGISKRKLKKMILDGKSMSVISKKPFFYSSSIVGGSIPLALGVAKGIKLRNKSNKVFCFIGDMTYETGIFHEAYKYSRNFDLPLEFIIEDNNMSTNTPTSEAWNKKSKIYDDIFYYKYERSYPHHGTGNWVLF